MKNGWLGLIALGGAVLGLAEGYRQSNADSAELQEISTDQLKQHANLENGVWITRFDPNSKRYEVFDVTDFVTQHQVARKIYYWPVVIPSKNGGPPMLQGILNQPLRPRF